MKPGEALRSGAFGFVLKEAADTELLPAIDAASNHRRYINPQLGALIAGQPEAPSATRADLVAYAHEHRLLDTDVRR